MKKILLLGLIALAIPFSGISQQWIQLGSNLTIDNTHAQIKVTQNGKAVRSYISTSNIGKVEVWNQPNGTWDALSAPAGASTSVQDFYLGINNNDICVAYKSSSSGTLIIRRYNAGTGNWDFLGSVGSSSYRQGTGHLFCNSNTNGIYFAYVNNLNNRANVVKFNGSSFTSIAISGSVSTDDVNEVKGYANDDEDVYVVYETDFGGFVEDFPVYKYTSGSGAFSLVENLDDDGSNANIEFFDIYGDKENPSDIPMIAWNYGYATNDVIKTATVNTSGSALIYYNDQNSFFDVYSLAVGRTNGALVLHSRYGQSSTDVQLNKANGSTSSWGMVGGGIHNFRSYNTDLGYQRYSGKPYALYQTQPGASHILAVKVYNFAPGVDDFGFPKPIVCSDAVNSKVLDYLLVLDDDNDSVWVESIVSDNQSIITNASLDWNRTNPYNPSSPQNQFEIFATPNPGTQGTVTITVTLTDGLETTQHQFSVFVSTPSPTFTQTSYETCNSASPVTLMQNVSPTGGVFSGPGIQNNKFYPNLAGVGVHTIIYTYTNAGGCVGTTTANIEVLAKPTVTLAITNATCSGDDGEVDATISGGASPYDIYWSNGETTEDVDELDAGIYYINVTDDNGCQTTKMANVSSDAFTVTGIVSDVSCYGGNDGGVDITINGTSGPYSVEWLNNGSTNEDATNIVAGTWEVYIEDANGCSVTEVFEVNEPDPITWIETVIESTCGGSNGSATCNVSGGTAPYNFQWFDDQGSPIGTNSDNLSGIPAGEYSVLITDDNGCSKIWNTVVTEVGGPQVVIDTVVHAGCTNNGSIDISINTTNTIQSINWNNGATSEDLSNLAPGYYAVQVIDNNGCTGMAGANVNNSNPAPIEICLVTVDTNTITNKVVWEKPVSTSITYFRIYRETSTAGQYQLIDSVAYADESFFVDTVAYPHIKSWRYKISVVNDCGVESDLSPAHKTIHLVKNLALGGGVNLSWDQYEGFSYPTYFIYRHTDVNGWEQIDQVASSAATSYNDMPPSTNELDYFVSIEPPSVCESTKATSHNASRSNRSSGIQGPNGGGNADDLNVEEIEVADLKLFPNPTTNFVNIQWENLNGQAMYDLYDGAGKLIRSWGSNKMYETINLGGLERGMYVISIMNNDVKYQYRIIKQ